MSLLSYEDKKGGFVDSEPEFTDDELIQMMAIFCGYFFSTSSNKPNIHGISRIKKLLYVRDMFFMYDIYLNDFDSIDDNNLDIIYNLCNSDYYNELVRVESSYRNGKTLRNVCRKPSNRSALDVLLWKLENKNLYDDLSDNKKLLVAHSIDNEYLLFNKFLKKVDNASFLFNDTFYNNDSGFFRKELDFLYKKGFFNNPSNYNNISIYETGVIEAFCLRKDENFKITGFISIFNYIMSDDNKIFLYDFSDKSIKDLYKVKFTRKQRKFILEKLNELDIDSIISLNNDHCIVSHFRALSKRLHPKDYKDEFPNAYKLFQELKPASEKKVELKSNSIDSKIHQMYNKGYDIISIAKYLLDKPNVFVSRYDSFMRRAEKRNNIKIGGECEVDILLDLLIDIKLSKEDIDSLLEFYQRRDNKKERNLTKKTSSPELVNCIVDILTTKKFLL